MKRNIIKIFGKKDLYQDPVLHHIWSDLLKGFMCIPWNNSLVQFFFLHLESLRPKLWKKHQKPFTKFCDYLYETYLGPDAMFPHELWNHFDQLMTRNEADMTTNSSESVNSGLNKHCPPLRKENAIYMRILRHKRHHFNRYIDKVRMNNLASSKRRRVTTERFEKLQELCIAYDCLSGPERQESLIEFLGKFSCTGNIPKLSKGDIEDGSDIASSSDSESE